MGVYSDNNSLIIGVKKIKATIIIIFLISFFSKSMTLIYPIFISFDVILNRQKII
jgi:hypothetical protein